MSDQDLQRKIHETVIRIDERQEAHCARFDEHVVQTDGRFAHLNRTVYGANGAAGLKSDVAVLKDQSERRKWALPALVTGLLGLAGAVSAFYLTR